MSPFLFLLLSTFACSPSCFASLSSINSDTGLVYQLPFIKHKIGANWSNQQWKNLNNKELGQRSLRETMFDFRDYFYSMPVFIGTPLQKFNIIMDTGSSDFWVVGSECCKNGNGKITEPNISPIFNKTASSTYVSTKKYMQVQYGGGNMLEGPVGLDTIRFDVNGNFTIPNTPVALIKQMDAHTMELMSSNSKGAQYFDGIMGLGFADKSQSDPPLVHAHKIGIFKRAMFTFYLNTEGTAKPRGDGEENDDDERNRDGGVLTFGGVDPLHCKSKVHWIPLANVRIPAWFIKIENVNYAGKKLSTRPFAGIPDSGTSLIIAPPDVAMKIYETVGNVDPATLSIPCDHEYEPIVFQIGGKQYSIGRELLTLHGADNKCTFGIDAKNFGIWILGDVFMRKYCTIFDMDNRRIGLTETKKKN